MTRKDSAYGPLHGHHRLAAPRPGTFGYLATFSNASDRDPGVISAARLDAGPLWQGARFRLVAPFLGLHLALTYEVVKFAPGCEVVLVAVSRLMSATDRIIVTAEEDGATVSYEAAVQLLRVRQRTRVGAQRSVQNYPLEPRREVTP